MVNPHESSSETFMVFLKSSHRPKSLYHASIRKARCLSCKQMGMKTQASSSPACTLTLSRGTWGEARLPAPTTAQSATTLAPAAHRRQEGWSKEDRVLGVGKVRRL